LRETTPSKRRRHSIIGAGRPALGEEIVKRLDQARGTEPNRAAKLPKAGSAPAAVQQVIKIDLTTP
jgi:hypothetical protein